MKKVFILFCCISVISGCDNNEKFAKDAQYEKDKADRIEQIKDSLIKGSNYDLLSDTTGLGEAPVRVTKAFVYTEEYSSYKSISVTYKNVSGKTIDAISFRWYGETAFGDPADMGQSIVDGYGGGFTETELKSGRSRTSRWSILSQNAKKNIRAWPAEVAFKDGTKWQLHSEYN